MQGSNTAYIEKLDHLRALAVILVIMFHAKLLTLGKVIGADKFQILPFDEGHIGVTLFMVISGYILTKATYGADIDYRKFYWNRMLRIYPLYVTVVALWYFSTPDPRPPETGINFLLALLPISNMYRTTYGLYGDSFWSLAVELQFYTIFPVITFAALRFGVKSCIVAVLFMIILRAGVFVLNGTVHQMSFFSIFGCLDAFLIGCAASLLQNKFVPGRCFSALTVLSILMLIGLLFFAFGHRSFFHVDYDHVTINGVSGSRLWILWPTLLSFCWAAVLLSYLNTKGRVPFSGAVAWLGRISYSMYVWHIFVALILLKIAPLSYLTPYTFGMFLIIPFTIAISALSYYVVESSFLELRVSYRITSPSAPG